MRALLRILPWLIVLAALAWGLWLGAETAWRKITGHDAFMVSACGIAFEFPGYINKTGMQKHLLERLRGLPDSVHVFDRQITATVAEELLKSPWVPEVINVRRLLPGSLRVNALFREPAGIVELRGQLYLIDRDGYWLPEDLFLVPETWEDQPPPVIVHEGIRRLPHRGRLWDGTALPAGAGLSRFLQESPSLELLDIEKINVTNVGAEMRGRDMADITLITATGAVIGWGTADDYSSIEGLVRRGAEPSDAGKLEALREFLEDYPELRGIRYLDLRFKKITYAPSDE